MKRKKKKIPGKKSLIFRRMIVPIIVSVLAGVIFHYFPVIRVDENCSVQGLHTNQILLASSISEIEPGDLVVFEYEGVILIQRCIGKAGDSISIHPDGIVSVNGTEIEEPYVINQQDASDDIYPYTVPIDRYFVLNDDRSNVADSRSVQFGCISAQQVIGKVLLTK